MEWGFALNVYQRFRQKAFRNESRRKRRSPGRSRWPEPDSLRLITGCASESHQQFVVAANLLPCFPKAVLGLPIVFKFADSDPSECHDPDRDPGKLTLHAHVGDDKETGEPTGDRMGSPVLIRPYWRPDLGQWVAAFLFLDAAHALAMTAYLSGEDALAEGSTWPVPNEQIVGASVRKFEPTRGFPNALDALKAFVHAEFKRDRRGSREVKG